MKKMRILQAALTICLASYLQAGEYHWNITSGNWDTSTANWNGDATVWSDGTVNAALFNNTSERTTVTIEGARTAGAIQVGIGGNNANYTFSSGTGGSLSAASFVVQGKSDNYLGGGPTRLDNLALTTTGDLGIGRWMLTIMGTSVVNVGGMITGSTPGITSADWGSLTIQDSAAVTAALGVDCCSFVWDIRLNGGSLTTPFLRAMDGFWGSDGRLVFNGGRLIASASSTDFLPIYYNGRAWINSGGAIIDTAANDIVIQSKLVNDSYGPIEDGGLTKFGTGKLTLSGINTYNGGTTVMAGTLATTGSTVLPPSTVLSIASGASVALDFSGTNAIHELLLNGVQKSPGIWGADGSGAQFTSAQFAGTGFLLVSGTYGWNTGAGDWDTVTANWSGAGTKWVDGPDNDAVFDNTNASATVTIAGARTAGVVKVGNGGNNANYTFSSGSEGSLSAASFIVQGKPSNDFTTYGTTVLDNLALTTIGDLGMGRWMLTIMGTSTVNVGGKITGNTAGITSADWGSLTIQDSAAVTADHGVDSYDHVWEIHLNGGSLTTPFLGARDGRWSDYINVHLTFNGGRLIASASNSDFLKVNDNGQAWVNIGGAKIDSGTNDITIRSKLIHDSSGPATDGGLTKFGTGSLTLAGINTYNGVTKVEAGTLITTGSTVLPSATDLSVASGASMALNFSGTNKVNSLTLGGVPLWRGIWGGLASPAQHKQPQFSGTGVLQVINGPNVPGLLILVL